MKVTIKTERGFDAAKNKPVSCPGTPVFRFRGTCSKGNDTEFSMDQDAVSRHALLLGGTGSGKTNLMFEIADQAIRGMRENDVMIIFDSKGDYYQQFGASPNTLLLGNSPEYTGKTRKWNLFREILADGPDRDVCRLNATEIARSLFTQRMRSTTNAFFPSAAQDVFASLLVSICRDAETDESARAALNNQDLAYYLQSSDPETLCGQLSAYDDLRATVSYIAGDSEQAQGVLSEMYSVIRDVLIGIFAGRGSFSIRRFIRSRGKKILFIEYDLAIGNILTPIYRLLIDLALKEALSQHSRGGSVYLFLDEFKLLPHLEHIEDAVNFGRSKGVKVFAGLQSIEQLYDIYGQSKGRSIAAGFSSVFAFKANDEATMKYISGLYGRSLVSVEIISSDSKNYSSVQSGFVVEDWILSGLGRGDALVSLPSVPPFVFHFNRFG